MTAKRIILVRHQAPLRVISEEEPLTALEPDELAAARAPLVFDSRDLAEAVEGGHWDSSDAWVRERAFQLQEVVERDGGEVHYFTMAEVPHIVGLAAHFGDAVPVHVHDHRDEQGVSNWSWQTDKKTFDLAVSALPSEIVSQPGEATLVIEISYPIDQALVDSLVGGDLLSAIRITIADQPPTRGIVKSVADLWEVREAVRDALAALRRARPGLQRIHLFIAAPPSVCFAVGQELQLRNGTDVQTYRYRSNDPAEPYKPALLLTSRGLPGTARPLTEEETALAADLRSVCRQALTDVKEHAAQLRSADGDWYAGFSFADKLTAIKPFRALRPLHALVKDDDEFDDTPREVDYEFVTKDVRRWRMSDRLILAFYNAAGKDRERMRQLVRLFYYHEYLHDFQNLTKYTAEDVGSFANCLEAIDYMADTYALLHQLDHATRAGSDFSNDKDQRLFLGEQMDLAIRSFWAFEPAAPAYVWQERRLRRYLNWYWRRAQISRLNTVAHAVRRLARQPHVEVAGLTYQTGRGRQFVVLNKPRPGDKVEIGLVLESGAFWRQGSATDLDIEETMLAFANHDQVAIDRFFSSLYHHVAQKDEGAAEEE